MGALAEHPPRSRPSVTVLMDGVRRAWMAELLKRDNRILDAQVMASLRQGTAFFASTALLAVGGTLALIGNVDPLAGLAREIGAEAPSPLVWQVRLLPAALLLTVAFLRFAWSNRVFGHASVMMAAVPSDPLDPHAPRRAEAAAALLVRASRDFNRGLRALYMALASAAWLAGPLALTLASAALAALLLWREFASVPRAVLDDG